MAASTPTGFWVTFVSGFLALAGIGAKGVADINLERAKLDSQLIIGALASPNVEVRRESLRLLVDTGLIFDKSARQGLKQYFEGEAPRTPPQIAPFIKSGEAMQLTPSTDENKSRTDVGLFVCKSASTSEKAKKIVDDIHNAISVSNHFGAVTLKAWDGSLYSQISEKSLTGYTTLIIDETHPENNEERAVREAVQIVRDMPPLRVVGNTGKVTPWNLSLIVCPS
jgi:hypothetical protein